MSKPLERVVKPLKVHNEVHKCINICQKFSTGYHAECSETNFKFLRGPGGPLPRDGQNRVLCFFL